MEKLTVEDDDIENAKKGRKQSYDDFQWNLNGPQYAAYNNYTQSSKLSSRGKNSRRLTDKTRMTANFKLPSPKIDQSKNKGQLERTLTQRQPLTQKLS